MLSCYLVKDWIIGLTPGGGKGKCLKVLWWAAGICDWHFSLFSDI